MRIRLKFNSLALALACLVPFFASAGGGGLNVAVVVNQASTNSVQLGNYYVEKRGVPPQNLIRINWSGSRTEWTNTEFSSFLLTPLRTAFNNRQLTNQVDYLVLSMDIPYRVVKNGSVNSTTSALFYGFKEDDGAPGPGVPASCSLPSTSASALAGSELPFRQVSPGSISPTNLLVTMITASNLALAKLTVDRGVAADGSFPGQTVYLGKGPDYARNIRYQIHDNAVFENRVRGLLSIERTEATGPYGFGSIFGFESGAYNYGIAQVSFAPGAMADNLTSYGGLLFQDNGAQLNILGLTAAGATGSYGTVVEPCAYFEKFPSPMAYFYQARGFNLAECYYSSLTNPYQGIVVGEPLAAPFALAGQGSWTQPSQPGAILTGVTNISSLFTAPDPLHPLQQVDLFLDGQWIQTITNLTPLRDNMLTVSLNGTTVSYSVPGNATIKSVAAGTAAAINLKAPLTHVTATAIGDRIQLIHDDPAVPADRISTFAESSIGPSAALTTFITPSRTNFLASSACPIREFTVSGPVAVGSYLTLSVIRTNGAQTALGVTNATAGITLLDFSQLLVNLINNPTNGLQAGDGLKAQDLQDQTVGATPKVSFALKANATGWPASRIQARLGGSFTFTPVAQSLIDENLYDLKHRNHLYVSAGLNTLSATLAFNTRSQPDGSHQLTAIAYEGSSVRTQTRADLPVMIRNNAWSASLIPLMAGSNTMLSSTLQFRVIASTNTISKIELYSTGGLVGSANGVSEANFSVLGGPLGLGLHPFHAIVTATNGERYRTAPILVRLVDSAPSPVIALTTAPQTLSWPAVAGRSYQILAATNSPGPYEPQVTLNATNSFLQWMIPGSQSPAFYRVRML